MKLVRLVAVLIVALAQGVAAQGTASPPASGTTTELTIPSRTYPQGRHAWVHTPAGYPASCTPACDLVVAFDGAEYRDTMALPHILDSLAAAHRIRHAVAVLIDNGEARGRLADLANSKRFAGFVAEEMMQWVRSHYAVTHAPERTLITGSSAGGLAAAYIAMHYPKLFGNVLSQSGAFWRGNEGNNGPPYEWLTQRVASLPPVKVRFFLDVGSREMVGAMGGAAPSILEANRHLHVALTSKGYQVDYFEVPGGVHSPQTWRGRLPIGIVALLSFPPPER